VSRRTLTSETRLGPVLIGNTQESMGIDQLNHTIL
jgi:hypothetical protein